MLPLSADVPKCLLPYRGATILEHLLALVKGHGISDITIVNGFAAEQLQKVAGSDLRYIHNPDYLITNSLYSLYLARQFLDTEVLLLNSDVIISAPALGKVIKERHPNALLVDFDKNLVDGEMNVQVRQGFVSRIGKDLPAIEANAESVQVCKFGGTATKRLREELVRRISLGDVNKFPPFIYGPVIEGERIKALAINGLPWHEIDTPEDYRRACRDLEE